MNLTNILLQAQQGGSSLSGILMIVAMIAIFYFMMIRPQNKKQKELKRQREAMKKGDKIVTAGGIHGRIRELSDTTAQIEVASGVTIKVDRASIYPADAAAAPAKKESKAEKAEKAGASEAKEEEKSEK